MGAPRARRVCGAPFGEESPDRRPKKAKQNLTGRPPLLCPTGTLPTVFPTSHPKPAPLSIFGGHPAAPCRFSHSRHGENNAHPAAPLRGGKNPRAMNPVSRTSVIKKQVRQRHAAERQAKPAANRAERERRRKRKTERSESAAEATAGFKKICFRRFAPWARPGRAGFAARLLAKKAPTADRKRLNKT